MSHPNGWGSVQGVASGIRLSKNQSLKKPMGQNESSAPRDRSQKALSAF